MQIHSTPKRKEDVHFSCIHSIPFYFAHFWPSSTSVLHSRVTRARCRLNSVFTSSNDYFSLKLTELTWCNGDKCCGITVTERCTLKTDQDCKPQLRRFWVSSKAPPPSQGRFGGLTSPRQNFNQPLNTLRFHWFLQWKMKRASFLKRIPTDKMQLKTLFNPEGHECWVESAATSAELWCRQSWEESRFEKPDYKQSHVVTDIYFITIATGLLISGHTITISSPSVLRK